MSGFGADLKTDPKQNPNVIGSLNKPFTSELLLKTVETYMPKDTDNPPASLDSPAETPAQEEPVLSNWTPQGNFQPFSEAPVPIEPAPAPFSLASEPEPVQQSSETAQIESAVGGNDDAWWSAAPSPATAWQEPAPQTPAPFAEQSSSSAALPEKLPIS